MTNYSLNYRMTKNGIEYFDDAGTLYLYAEAHVSDKGPIRYRVQIPDTIMKRSRLGGKVNTESLPNLKAVEYLALAIANSIE